MSASESARQPLSQATRKGKRGGIRGWETEGARSVPRQSRTRFKVFTQARRSRVRPTPSSRFAIVPALCASRLDRCADELVDAFIAVPVTSLSRGGASPSHDRDRPKFASGITLRVIAPYFFAETRSRTRPGTWWTPSPRFDTPLPPPDPGSSVSPRSSANHPSRSMDLGGRASAESIRRSAGSAGRCGTKAWKFSAELPLPKLSLREWRRNCERV